MHKEQYAVLYSGYVSVQTSLKRRKIHSNNNNNNTFKRNGF